LQDAFNCVFFDFKIGPINLNTDEKINRYFKKYLGY